MESDDPRLFTSSPHINLEFGDATMTTNNNKISRRKVFTGALAAGAAGLAASATPRVYAQGASTRGGEAPQVAGLPPVWGEDFLTQWSPPENVERDLTAGDATIRLASSNSSFGRLMNEEGTDYASQFRAWREAGWTACEAGSTNWLSRRIPDPEIREIKEQLAANDIVFYGIHCGGNIIGPGSVAEESQRHIIETINAAEEMGCELVLTHAGGLHPNRNYAHPQNWSRDAWMKTVNALKRICRDTAGSNIKIDIEAVNCESINNPWAHKRLIEDVGDPRIGVGLDVTNFVHAGVAFRMTELIDITFDLLEDHINYIHAKDLVWNEMMPGLNWALQGTGLMDYEMYLARISRLKTDPYMLIEFLSEDEQYEQAQRNVRTIAEQLGVNIYGSQA